MMWLVLWGCMSAAFAAGWTVARRCRGKPDKGEMPKIAKYRNGCWRNEPDDV